MGHIRFQTTLAVVEFSCNEKKHDAEEAELDNFIVMLNHRIHEEVSTDLIFTSSWTFNDIKTYVFLPHGLKTYSDFGLFIEEIRKEFTAKMKTFCSKIIELDFGGDDEEVTFITIDGERNQIGKYHR